MPLKDDHRERVLALHESGLNRREITEVVPISSAYVSQIVSEAGRSFPDSERTFPATQGRIANQAQRRLAQAEILADLTLRALAAGQDNAAIGLAGTLNKLDV